MNQALSSQTQFEMQPKEPDEPPAQLAQTCSLFLFPVVFPLTYQLCSLEELSAAT